MCLSRFLSVVLCFWVVVGGDLLLLLLLLEEAKDAVLLGHADEPVDGEGGEDVEDDVGKKDAVVEKQVSDRFLKR